MFTNDFIMREIENITRFLGNMLFMKDTKRIEIFSPEWEISESGMLYCRLRQLIDEKRINEAENFLFETIEENPCDEMLEVALKFYEDLQNHTEEYLEECGFSKDEILDGLKDLNDIFVAGAGNL